MRAIEILQIEDNFADVSLTKSAIDQLDTLTNYNHVSDGFEGIKYLKKEGKYEEVKTPDVIFLDLNLPRVDGFGVLQAIKSDDNLSMIPIIVMSTSENRTDVSKCYKLHANAFIAKEIDFFNFVDNLKNIESFWFNNCILPSKNELNF